MIESSAVLTSIGTSKVDDQGATLTDPDTSTYEDQVPVTLSLTNPHLPDDRATIDLLSHARTTHDLLGQFIPSFRGRPRRELSKVRSSCWPRRRTR